MPEKQAITRPNFKSEAEEADWYHTPEGQAYSKQQWQKERREGRIRFHVPPGVAPVDRAELKKLIAAAQAKMTESVSILIPKGDLDAAKRVADAEGKGHQTVLKEIIHAGLVGR